MTTVGVRGALADVFPPFLYEAYRSTIKRAPHQPFIELVHPTLTELTGPGDAVSRITAEDADLTRNGATGGEPLGERILVTGRVTDETGRSLPRTLVEIWQSNASGRYRHRNDQSSFPLDPNFIGLGRTLTNDEGRYRFLTIKPGRYTWQAQGDNVWRPAHIHFSLFGEGARSRVITQMYFPDDPLLAGDPIYQAIPTPEARARLLSRYSPEDGLPQIALGYRWDIVLRGPNATPSEAWREGTR